MTPPRTQADVNHALARDAMRRGEAALSAGDHATAREWLARAHRIAPDDPAVALSLAGVMLGLHDPEAVRLFQFAADETQTREAWLGLAAACWQGGDMSRGAAALNCALSQNVLPEPISLMSGLADALCQATAAPGWCGVAADGAERVLRVVTQGCVRPPRVLVDGHPLRGTALPAGRSVSVTAGGRALLGSPIDLARLRVAEGVVGATRDGGLEGWIWLPADPDADPRVAVEGLSARRHRQSESITLRATDTGITADRPLSRPRRFSVPAAALSHLGDRLRVTGPDGVELAGSPVDVDAELRAAMWVSRAAQAAEPALAEANPTAAGDVPPDLAASADLRGPAAAATCEPARPVAVVVPVYRDAARTIACLDSVLTSCSADTRLIVVDDATPEPDLALALDRLAAAGRISLLRHKENAGFPASANAGLRAAFALRPHHDALLLNSDTLVPATRSRWLERLRASVHAAPDIGTATPLSNDATILTYPDRDLPGAVPDEAALDRLDALAAKANAGVTIDIPTAVGFCMYVRWECAVDTGLFRTALFAQGYGEENDFCIRARHLGWRHVAVPGVVVGHVGGVSFGARRQGLIRRNLAVLERLHPGYHALIATYRGRVPAMDALAPARRRLDAARWSARRGLASARQAVVLITHDQGGGVDRVVRGRIAALAASGVLPIVLRPVPDPESEGGFMPGLCRVDDGTGAFPNLVYHLPGDLKLLAQLLRGDRPTALEVHHRLGHHPSLLDLAGLLRLKPDLMLHDYASFCPRVTLLGPEQRYCGEPEPVAVCEACVADAGSRLGDDIDVAALRARSAAEFSQARSISVPSADMARRMRRHFPQIDPTVTPLENDAALLAQTGQAAVAGARRRVCVIGAIGIDKGFDVLLACARDAALRDLALEFVLVGRSIDDNRLLDTGRVFVTGSYREEDALALIVAQSAQLAFLPSIWPETWGFTLGLAWQAGLSAVVFDIGAMAARVRQAGAGQVLPLGLPAGAINAALMAPVARFRAPSLADGRQDRLWKQVKTT